VHLCWSIRRSSSSDRDPEEVFSAALHTPEAMIKEEADGEFSRTTSGVCQTASAGVGGVGGDGRQDAPSRMEQFIASGVTGALLLEGLGGSAEGWKDVLGVAGRHRHCDSCACFRQLEP